MIPLPVQSWAGLSVRVVSETPYEALPPAAHERMGMRPGQKNLLLRLTLRDPARTLTRGEANRIRDLKKIPTKTWLDPEL